MNAATINHVEDRFKPEGSVYGENPVMDGDTPYAQAWEARVEADEPSDLDRANAAMRSLEQIIDATADLEKHADAHKVALATFSRARSCARLTAKLERADDKRSRIVADALEALAKRMGADPVPALDTNWGRREGGRA